MRRALLGSIARCIPYFYRDASPAAILAPSPAAILSFLLPPRYSGSLELLSLVTLVHNLGAEVLLAYQQVRAGHLHLLAEPIDPHAYRRARRDLENLERPARQRRSFVRHLDRHLSDLLSRWLAPS
jgi:hypothetical protein